MVVQVSQQCLRIGIYPKRLFSQEWNVKPRRGRQRGNMIDDIFLSLGLDK